MCGVCPEFKEKLTTEFDSFEKLGDGGFGQVVKARSKLDGEFYAIKKINKTTTETKYLKNEIVIKNLKHENIINYVQCWEDSKFLYIQMELCDGDLVDWLKKNKNNKQENLKIAKQIISGVQYLHKKKLIHRDLKVDIIFLMCFSSVLERKFKQCLIKFYLFLLNSPEISYLAKMGG